jgi:hypothetical protein
MGLDEVFISGCFVSLGSGRSGRAGGRVPGCQSESRFGVRKRSDRITVEDRIDGHGDDPVREPSARGTHDVRNSPPLRGETRSNRKRATMPIRTLPQARRWNNFGPTESRSRCLSMLL